MKMLGTGHIFQEEKGDGISEGSDDQEVECGGDQGILICSSRG